MGWSFATASPTLSQSEALRPFSSSPRLPRRIIRRAWRWFDRLTDLQTAALLSTMLVGLTCLSLALLAANLTPRTAAPPAPEVAAVAVPTAAPAPTPTTAPRPTRARTVPVIGVNLRAGPTTSAALLATLPSSTGVWLMGETARSDDFVWQHVRTEDGRDGWVIGSALE
jgi:hypothetical protein